MGQLGRFQIIVQDTAGNASSGASITIYRQGATIQGLQTGTAFAVDDPGAIVVGDTVFPQSNPNLTRNVTAVSATTVTVGGPAFTLQDDDRLIPSTTLPTLYADAMGNDTVANPLTSSSTGEAKTWILGGSYDILISGGTPALAQTFYPDFRVSAEKLRTNIFDDATLGTGFIWDTARTLTLGNAKLISIRNNTSEKFSVAADGSWTSSQGGTITAGGLTVSAGGITVTGNSTITGTLGGLTGFTLASGNLTVSAGDIIYRRTRAAKGTAHVAGDWALSAGWGVGATLSVGFGAKDQGGFIQITAAGTPTANPTVTLTFKDGGWLGNVFGVGQRGDIAAPTTGFWAFTTQGTTQVVWTFVGTPVAANVYNLVYWHFSIVA